MYSARFIWLRSLLIVALAFASRIVYAAPAIQVDLASRIAWTFRPEGVAGSGKPLAVPAGGWRLNGFPNASAGVYERRILIPKLPGGGAQTSLLAFEAVNWEAIVSVGLNAGHLHEAGRHLSAWTPFQVDISPYVTPGQEALVRVQVRDRDSFKDKEGHFTVPAGVEWNDRQARGIIRGVSLQIFPAVYIADVFVRPNTANNTLSYDVTLANSTAQARQMVLSARFSAATPGAHWTYPVPPLPRALRVAAHSTQTVTFGPISWTPGRDSWWWPNVPFDPKYRAQLHNLILTLHPPGAEAQNSPLQKEVARFGFCTPGQSGNFYTFNGVRINLRGDSLPEGTIGTDAFARLPGFLPPSANNPGWPEAVRNYLRLNFNVVRMHQVPATRYMLDVCDELGLLVIPETAIRGGGGSKENITIYPDAFMTHLRELVLRDRKHPCVFKWSLENELFGAPEPFMHRLYATCMQADGARPCSIDDNAEYPSWHGFAVIEHYSQPPGTPDAAGGRARTDRPYGQGEYVWPLGNTPPGAIWFGLEARSLRAHDNADVRLYTLIDAWPGVIPGLTPTDFPDPHLPPDSLEQGGHSLLDPAEPWENLDIQLLQRSFAPVAAYDLDYDDHTMAVNHRGLWPAALPPLPAGRLTVRRLTVFNDEFTGETLQVSIEPTLRIAMNRPDRQPTLSKTVYVSPGGHVVVSFDVPVPPVPHNSLLQLTLRVRKAAQERYAETDSFVVVPQGVQGTQAVFAGRDDKTSGNWPGVYGKEAFFLPIFAGTATYAQPQIKIQRGTGFTTGENTNTPLDEMQEYQLAFDTLVHAHSVDDPRIPLGGNGLTTRDPIVFSAHPIYMHNPHTHALVRKPIPLIMRVDTQDGNPHQLSLYFLDFARTGQALDIDVYDLQGHPLDARWLTDFGNGVYLRWRITGNVIVVVSSLTQDNPTTSGVFVDPATSQT